MKDILKLNSISKVALPVLDGYNVTDSSANPVGILVRSYNMAEYAVPESLLAVARAGAGVNNIPHADYAKLGICVFNTPGANANAVKELVIGAMIIASRNIYEGISWAGTLKDDVSKQVEKGKSAFAGSELTGKTLAVFGLGAIGRKVATSANALGMNVVGYDPYLSAAAYSEIPFVTVHSSMQSAFAEADVISLHMPMTEETKNMINADSINLMKDGVIIINAARGELVSTAAVKEALQNKKVKKYVTDFPDAGTVGCEGIITIPHLGASTEEAEDNCAAMAAEELKDYIEYGNIKNSVNFPSLNVAKTKAHRLTVISKDGTKLGYEGVSVSKNGVTYTVIDSDAVIDVSSVCSDGVIKARNLY